MPRAKRVSTDGMRRDPPAMTPEDREDQLIALAFDLAEERLRDKTASNQLVAEIVRYGSTKERLQKEKLLRENEVLRVKAEAMETLRRSDEQYERVIQAIKLYNGSSDGEDEYEEEY